MDEVEAVGEQAHELLVALRKGKPYVKETTDAHWAAVHGTSQVNLASLKYSELPSDWKYERDAGAKIALDAVHAALSEKRSLNSEFVEEVANVLHHKWLERNGHRAGEIQMRSYADMPETEKEKDRCFVKAAMQVIAHGS